MAHAQSLLRARRIVGLAAPLVPARLREEWRAEWDGELAAAADHPRARLTRYALGAFADAFWMRQRDAADFQIVDDLRHGFRHWRQQSGFVIAAIGILALSMAASVTAWTTCRARILTPGGSASPISQLPTPTATAPARMKSAAVSAVTPPLGTSGMSGNCSGQRRTTASSSSSPSAARSR